jgi:hypothetical protein
VHETLAPYADADAEQAGEAMAVVAQLIQGKPLGEEFWTTEKKRTATHVWRPAQVRGVHVGDTVRIKANQRVGKVSALRGGVIVMLDNVVSKSTSMGIRYTIDELEVQIPIPRRVTK